MSRHKQEPLHWECGLSVDAIAGKVPLLPDGDLSKWGDQRMLRRALLGLSVVASLAAAPATASSFAGIYVFGDSLSDVGNLYYGFGGVYGPVSPPYDNGRSSNGPLWVEDVAAALGLGPVTPSLLGGNDYAVAGASSGPTDIYTAMLGDLPWQIGQFELDHSSASPTALYTLSMGANDIFNVVNTLLGGATFDIDAAIAESAANTAAFIAELHSKGAENLLLFDVPNLDLIPKVTEISAFYPSGVPTPGELAALFNADLLKDIEPLIAGGFKLFDIHSYDGIGEVVANPDAFEAKYGLSFNNVTDPCWTGNFTDAGSGAVCSDPSHYLFWDTQHPTAAGHQLVADFALAAIPEPSTWAMGLIGFAGLGLFALVRRTRRPSATAGARRG